MKKLLRAFVINKNERVKSHGDLLQIARSIAKTIEHTEHTIPIQALIYVAELDVFVALYEKPRSSRGLLQSPGKGEGF